MTRQVVRLTVPMLALFAGTAFLKGGWAVTVVDDLPDYAVVGRPLTLTFTVRQHGVRPLEGLKPRVEALGRGELKTYTAESRGSIFRRYRYATTITLPRAGDWIITIHSGFGNGRT